MLWLFVIFMLLCGLGFWAAAIEARPAPASRDWFILAGACLVLALMACLGAALGRVQ